MITFLTKAKSALGAISKGVLGSHHPVVTRLRQWNAHINKMLFRITDTKAVRSTNRGIATHRKMGVNIAGYITSEDGVGEAVRANIRAFEAAGIPYVLNNLTSSARQRDDTYGVFSRDNPYLINFIHINADQVPIFYLQKGGNYFKERYNIGYWVWELPDFPMEWTDRFKYFDEIWTASHFCSDSISKVSPIPVVRIPHSIYMTGITPVTKADYGIKEGNYIFLFMFDFMSYFERKNPLALVRAFKMAFQDNENVQLVLKCSNSEANPEALARLRDAASGYNVTFIDAFLRKGEIHSLINMADCYVSLHRSEGFGLPLAEAMYLGKPVIATAYSGNMDFMDVNNSFPVKYKLIEIEKDIGPYKAGSVWAEPDIHHAAELMRYVYENRETGKNIGSAASEDIKRNFNSYEVGKKILNRIKIITTRDMSP